MPLQPDPEAIPCARPRIEKLLHPTLGIMRGLRTSPPDKLINIKVRELREIADTLVLASKESDALRSALRTASCDTHPQGGASTKIEAPFMSGAVGATSAETPNLDRANSSSLGIQHD